MNLKDYQKLAQRTSSTKMREGKILNGILGLNGEVGELTDIFKKYFFQGHGLEAEKVKEEIGDIMWYLAEIATGLNLDLEEILILNIEKLKTRYPKGFDKERSVNR